MKSLLWAASFAIVALSQKVEANNVAQTCDAVVLSQSLTVELARDEAAALAALANSPRIDRLIEQGARRAGAKVYYSGIAIGATAVCMAQNLPPIELPDVEDVRDFLFGPDDPCEKEKEILRQAKKETRGTQQCLSGDTRATIEFKINRYERLLAARIATAICVGDDEPGHARQIQMVRAIVEKCRVRLP